MYSDITGYAPEWLETALSILGVTAVVVALVLLAPVVGGVEGAAMGAVAFATSFGAVRGGYSAYSNGTNLAAGILSGGVKGAAIGTAIGLGIMTGAGAFSGLSALGAFGTALGANFVGGMLSYTINNGLNGRNLDFSEATRTGFLQMTSGAFAFGAGCLIGVTGFYNIPGKTGMFSAPWLGNTSVGLLFKGVYYYPIDVLIQMM